MNTNTTIKFTVTLDLRPDEVNDVIMGALQSIATHEFPQLREADDIDAIDDLIDGLSAADRRTILTIICPKTMDSDSAFELLQAKDRSALDEWMPSSRVDEALLKWALASENMAAGLERLLQTEAAAAEKAKDEENRAIEKALAIIKKSGRFTVSLCEPKVKAKKA